jgi:hypothetical protein
MEVYRWKLALQQPFVGNKLFTIEKLSNKLLPLFILLHLRYKELHNY